ncbi:MAG TPA: phosphopentomutase [Bacteroidetes bacterium]|nr:MAG: phosphopentomutase [Ignavibacteria bacterium GWC2_56_12]OGU64843.1 MAG: phosphopentomutase [Ignavibacteria bacterium RIFCSPHIGHO2_02_FULL_56_12]HAV23867.1 phosphopentomutase [Bacteroidota bacterium]
MHGSRVILIVLDGVGIGALPDADAYGDRGAHTLAHVATAVHGLRLPHLAALGLGRLVPVEGVPGADRPSACFGRMAERSKGKDSTTGHWEIAGLITEHPFPTYPHGFPQDLIDAFVRATGVAGILGNTVASGTTIIAQRGDEHVRTGHPIVYTSADSVFQIAAHERVIPLERLYDICRTTRERVTVGKHAVGRVIARPFVGESGGYTRTPNRRDFAMQPPRPTMLDALHLAGIATVTVGKVEDLFAGRGVAKALHTSSNAEGIDRIVETLSSLDRGLIWANLVDFDTHFGHRQDAAGFAKALEAFDTELPRIMSAMRTGDLLVLTADHGNDPTDSSTDHSREFVPLLCALSGGASGVDLGSRNTFADLGATVIKYFGLQDNGMSGTSFLESLV